MFLLVYNERMKITKGNFLDKLLASIAWPAMKDARQFDEHSGHYAEGAALLDNLPASVTISRIRNKDYRYSANYKNGKRVNGSNLLEVLRKLQAQHKELDPLKLLYTQRDE